MESINLVYFSPTHSTEKILKAIADGTGAKKRIATDITFAGIYDTGALSPPTFVLIGFPVYGGRVPDIVISRIENLRGHGTLAAIVAVYGNRDFDDALLEMRDIMTDKGFTVVSAAAFVGEHSYTTEQYSIAKDRPDAKDLAIAYEYGRELGQFGFLDEKKDRVISLPGTYPYKEKKPNHHITPDTDREKCTKCLTCVSVCPTHSISADTPWVTNPETCIHCSACVKVCPSNAREFTDPRMVRTITWLVENCQTRREPELFL